MKKLKLNGVIYALALIVIIAFAVSKCSTDSIELALINERVDLVIKGDMNSFISLESEDLVSFEPSLDIAVYDGEFDLTLNLGDNNMLNLVIYNHFIDNPLDFNTPYPAYTADFIKGRSAYLVGEYVSNGEVVYSSISELKEHVEQINVLEIEDNGNHYKLFLQDFRLFASEKDNDNLEVPEINITGNFLLAK